VIEQVGEMPPAETPAGVPAQRATAAEFAAAEPVTREEEVPAQRVDAFLPPAEAPVAELTAEATTIPARAPIAEPAAHVEPPVPSARAALPEDPPTLAVDTKAYLGEAGLQLVETDPSKAVSIQPEPEPVKLGRARPERARTVEEDLVQVETRK